MMIDIHTLLNILYVTLGVAFLGTMGYLFFTRDAFRKGISRFLPWLTSIFQIASKSFVDKKDVFDTHDLLEMCSRLTVSFRNAVNDSNLSLEDLEGAIRDMVISELSALKDKGIKNVPDLSSEEVDRLVSTVMYSVRAVLDTDEQSEEN